MMACLLGCLLACLLACDRAIMIATECGGNGESMVCGRRHDYKKNADDDTECDNDNDDGHGVGDDTEDDSNDKL